MQLPTLVKPRDIVALDEDVLRTLVVREVAAEVLAVAVRYCYDADFQRRARAAMPTPQHLETFEAHLKGRVSVQIGKACATMVLLAARSFDDDLRAGRARLITAEEAPAILLERARACLGRAQESLERILERDDSLVPAEHDREAAEAVRGAENFLAGLPRRELPGSEPS